MLHVESGIRKTTLSNTIPRASRRHAVRQRVVLEAGVLQDGSLDRVVGGQVSQVDESRTLNVGPATPPQRTDATLGQDLPA